MDFTLIKKTKVYSDCSFDSDVIAEIKKNTTLHKLYSNGPWLRVKYNDNLVWLYPFEKNKLIINPINIDRTNDDKLKIGTVVYINPNQANNKYLNRDNKLIEVIGEKNRKKFFVIDSVKTIDGYYKVKAEDSSYFFVDESDIENAVDDETSDLISSYYAISLFSDEKEEEKKDDENKDKTDNTKSPYTIEEVTGFGEYNTVLKDAYNERVNSKYKNAVDLTKVNLTNLRTVFGMPYQYLPSADLRMDPDGSTGSQLKTTELQAIGMKYREKILSRMPLLVMMPGIVNFMPNYGYQAKETAIKNLMTESGENYTSNKAFDFLVNKNAKSRSSYYTFYPAWTEYFNYVNKMCAAAAVFMGVADVVMPYADSNRSDTLGNYRWQNALPSSLNSTFYKGSCAFYVNSETQISENYSNSTTQSQLASKVNSLSEKARELAFLSGGMSDMASAIGNVASSAASMASSAGAKLEQGATRMAIGQYAAKFRSQGVIQAIMGGIGNAAAGAKMQFPDLWQDSTFSRDYSATIKLDSPDNDPLSVYLNIIVPLIHLTAFAAPRSTGLTTYASPFLVRAYYQGFFNVNMGIISQMDITKGAEGAWTYNNIPTVVEVRLNIHDLFATQTITIDANNNSNFLDSLTNLDMLTNQPLMEYLANLCGVNYNEPEWNRLIDLAITLEKRKPIDFLNRIEDAVVQGWNNSISNVYQDAINSNKFGLVSLIGNFMIDNMANKARNALFGDPK